MSIAGRTILGWQLCALAAVGIKHVTVVTGFRGETIENAIKVISPPMEVDCLHNPFYSVADNIGSCWVARDLIGDDTVLINGDTLFDPRVLSHVLDKAQSPITVTIDRKATYDSDDMKVSTREGNLLRISKALTEDVNGESIGMLRFRDQGGARFVDRLSEKLRDPASLKLWYLSIIDELASEGGVGVVPIDGLPWAEVDFLHDLPIASGKIETFEWPEPAVDAQDSAAAESVV